MLQIGLLHVADGVPDAGQPMGDERKDAHEQHEHGRAVLRVAVQLAGHSHQPQETGRLQEPDECGGLGGWGGEETEQNQTPKNETTKVSILANYVTVCRWCWPLALPFLLFVRLSVWFHTVPFKVPVKCIRYSRSGLIHVCMGDKLVMHLISRMSEREIRYLHYWRDVEMLPANNLVPNVLNDVSVSL